MLDTKPRPIDVVVIGAGIVGICTTLSLLERGLKVTLIDRAEPGQGASYGNAGVISPWSLVPQSTPGLWKQVPGWLLDKDGPLTIRPSFLPRMIPWGLSFLSKGRAQTVASVSEAMSTLTLPSVDLYRRHLAGTGHECLVQDSSYVHAFRNASDADPAGLGYRLRKQYGAVLEVLGKDELRELEPGLSADFSAAMLIKGQARTLSPGRLATVLTEKAVALGAVLKCGTVRRILREESGGWAVETYGGKLSAPKIVVAAGAWSAKLLKPLGISLPLVGERGYHVEFDDPQVPVNNSVMDMDWKVVASSMEGGLRIAGTAEFASLDAPEDPRRYDNLVKAALKAFPGLNTSSVRTWMGHRPSFPDSLPVLGELPGVEGIFGAFGHSHYGLMMAPKSGALVADLVATRPLNLNLAPYSAERF